MGLSCHYLGPASVNIVSLGDGYLYKIMYQAYNKLIAKFENEV